MQRDSGERGPDRSVLLLLAGFLLLGGLVAATGWLAYDRATAVAWVRHSLTVQNDLAQAFSLLQDAESAERLYLLTGQERDLGHYRGAVAELGAALDSLGRETADNGRQQQALAMLRLAVQERLSQLRAVIERHQSGAEAEARAMVGSEAGRAALARARDAVARMRAEEDRLLGLREAAARRAGFWLAFGVAAVALLVLGLGVPCSSSARPWPASPGRCNCRASR